MNRFALTSKRILLLMAVLCVFEVFDYNILMILHLDHNENLELILSTIVTILHLFLIFLLFFIGKKITNHYMERERHYRNLVELSPEAIIINNDDEKVIYVNEAGVKLLGAPKQSMLLNRSWKEFIHPEYYDAVSSLIKGLNEKPVLSHQIKVKTLDGKTLDAEITSTMIDYDGKPARELIVRDITIQKRKERIIESLAYRDTLTLLPNRKAFMDKLIQMISDSNKNCTTFAVMFIDLDGFKQVNDSLGHEGGDHLLKQVSHCMKECLRDNDMLSRFAGDEFIALLSDVNQADCMIVARRIIQSLNSPFSILGNEVRVTASIGISVYPDDAMEAEVLIKYADMAMYKAKKQGKNSFQIFGKVV